MKVNGRRVKAPLIEEIRIFAGQHKLLVVVQQLPQPCLSLVVQLLVKLRPGEHKDVADNGQHRQRA